MNEDRQTQTKTRKLEYYDDEIELMDYLLVIWKWKYVIIAGTLAFGFAAAIISFIALKQQPTMYRTCIVLSSGILKIDEKGEKVFIDTPQNIKALIENDIEFKVLEQINNSNNSKLSTALDFQVDIHKGSDLINVSLDSASPDEGTAKLNYLNKALTSVYIYKYKYIKNDIDNTILLKKHEFDELSFKIKRIKAKIVKYEKELSEIESNRKLLKERKDNSPSRECFLNKLSVENDYLNTFQIYFKENENAKLDLFELQKKTSSLSKEIEKLEKEKQNIQTLQIVQPPITTELPKSSKIKRNVVLLSVLGLFMMLFLSFFLDYLSNYKKRGSNK